MLDINCTDKHTADTARAIHHALKKICSKDLPIILYGQCTNSGGGGTLHALACALKAHGLCHKNYFVASCMLHDLQTALRNAVEMVLGCGGKDEAGEYLQTCMQMLHGAYNLQNWFETEELKQMYLYIIQEQGLEIKYRQLTKQIVT